MKKALALLCSLFGVAGLFLMVTVIASYDIPDEYPSKWIFIGFCVSFYVAVGGLIIFYNTEDE